MNAILPPSPTTDILSANGVTLSLEVVIKQLAPELKAAAQALYARYSELDLQLHTTTRTIEQDFLAAMPVIDGQEENIRKMVQILTDDIRAEYGASDKPLLLRFVNQDAQDQIKQIAPDEVSRIVVVPVSSDASLHATIHQEQVTHAFEGMLEMARERFVMIADPSATPPVMNQEEKKLKQPLSEMQISSYQRVTNLLNMAMAGSNGGFMARAALASLIGSTNKLLLSLNNYSAVVAVAAEANRSLVAMQESVQIQQHVAQVQEQLKSHMGTELPAALHQSLRSGLQEIQKIDAAITGVAPQQVSVMELRTEAAVTPAVTKPQIVNESVGMPQLRLAERAPQLQTVVAVPRAESIVVTLPVATVSHASVVEQVEKPVQQHSAQIIPFRTEKLPEIVTPQPVTPPSSGITSLAPATQYVSVNAVSQVVLPVVPVTISQSVPAQTPEIIAVTEVAVQKQPEQKPAANEASKSAPLKDERDYTDRQKVLGRNDEDWNRSKQPQAADEPARKQDTSNFKTPLAQEDSRQPVKNPPPVIGGASMDGKNPIKDDFRQAAKGACAHCGGGGCSRCALKGHTHHHRHTHG